jgi:predicted dehydrogenase
MKSMQVALMGLGGGGQLVAEALLASTRCELVAVGSPISRRLEAFAETYPDIAIYGDFRSMIVENALDALFVAVPMFRRLPYLMIAAEHGVPVWMLAPASRTLEEALTICNAFDRMRCPLAVVRSWDAEPALPASQFGSEGLGRLFLARGSVLTCLPDDLEWRGDSVKAGGGALLDRGYPLIDMLVQAMGVPSTVYALTAGVSRPQTRCPYDTEDTAALVCHFTGGAIATIHVSWTTGPDQWWIEVFGTSGSVRIEKGSVLWRDRAGTIVDGPIDRPANPFLFQIEDFLSRLQTHPNSIRSQLRQHLPTMAVFDAAYLSARTGQPESPGTILDMHDVKEQMLPVPAHEAGDVIQQ